MALYSSLVGLINKNIASPFLEIVRFASKKSRTSTRIRPDHRRPKHRGIKVNDGSMINAGALVVTQLTPRFFPGLNVGIGKDGSLFTIEPGKVVVTTEKIDPNWNSRWVRRALVGRERSVVYKKYLNVLPYTQHQRFKLIEEI